MRILPCPSGFRALLFRLRKGFSGVYPVPADLFPVLFKQDQQENRNFYIRMVENEKCST